MEDEKIIGSVSSANLKRGLIKGYCLFVTNRRIIGVKDRKKGLKSAIAAGVIGGIFGIVGDLMAQKIADMSAEEKKELIRDIENKKDFEILKEDVERIELKKPSFFRSGHIIIKTKNGDEIKIVNYGKKEHDMLVRLMENFKPESIDIL